MDPVSAAQTNSIDPLKSAAGLYIHIPFCTEKCDYCDFAAFAGANKFADEYLSALDWEMSRAPDVSLATIYIGGGTPTVLSPTQIGRLFASIRVHFDVAEIVECTAEANPESSSDSVLRAFQTAGVDRLSFGLQTTDDALLARLDRRHTCAEFENAFRRARAMGFSNINVDLIYGFPGQTMDAWKATLDRVMAWAPEHISAYALKIEPGTKLAKLRTSVDDDEEASMYLAASERLRSAGYRHYEISNFSRPGFESRHNLMYWRNEATIGVGVSAASHADGRRWKNTSNLIRYLEAFRAGASAVEETVELSPEAAERERIMLELRLDDGTTANRLESLAVSEAEEFLRNNLAVRDGHRYRLKPEGWLVSNRLFQHLV